MKIAKHILPIIALSAITASCGSQKVAVPETQKVTTTTTTTTTKTTTTTTTTTTAAPTTAQVSHVAKIANSFGAWTTLKAGGSVSIGGSKPLSSSMQIRMERGKSIYISVRPMGIMEVARLVIV
ncbi:MAG: hypothetical protein SOZ50_08345, partial [Sodaliphilus sp.]|nr:hypothetical protein [Sodaliphilus sp.]